MIIYICDDTENDCLRLKHNLDTYQKTIRANYLISEFTVTTFFSGEQLLQTWNRNNIKPDLLFLDIYMTGGNGIDVARKLRNDGFDGGIIFTTSSKEHAMASYDVNALYYLQKPYTHSHFLNAMDKCKSILNASARCFRGFIRRKEYVIPYHEIVCFEISGHSVILHRMEDSLTFHLSMKEILSEVSDISYFLPCGKSYLVNLNYVDTCIDLNFILKNNFIVPIPYRSKNDVITAWQMWNLQYNKKP